MFRITGSQLAPAMEIKLKLDTEKTAKATVAIACAYRLARVSEASESPQLAAASTAPARPPKNPPKQPCVPTPSLSSSKRR